MAANITTIVSLVSQIKAEARVKGSDNLDNMILDILNELLLEEVHNHHYSEMLVINSPITLVDAQKAYALPTDFTDIRLVRYIRESGYTITLDPRSEYTEERISGNPKYYDISGGVILIFPFANVLAADALSLDYWKVPDQLALDTTPFPIIKLVGPIKQKAIARVHVYNKDMASAQMFSGMGAEDTERAHKGE